MALASPAVYASLEPDMPEPAVLEFSGDAQPSGADRLCSRPFGTGVAARRDGVASRRRAGYRGVGANRVVIR